MRDMIEECILEIQNRKNVLTMNSINPETSQRIEKWPIFDYYLVKVQEFKFCIKNLLCISLKVTFIYYLFTKSSIQYLIVSLS
jgi:hypothetical protein